ncbi:MAG TPA: uroporphyrinogen-III synthase [Flavobacterium sp.]|nr:uroporphyrinogen-III synthase [Flavobacterium sp.]
MTKIKLLSTRKLSEADKAMLPADRFDLIEEDFISITFLNFNFPEKTDLLLFTSQNAVISVLKNPLSYALKDIDVICVGEKTKELLETNGFKVIDFAHYASALSEIIRDNYIAYSITFFSGNLRRETLPSLFKKYRTIYKEIRVYQNDFSPKRINQKLDALLFYSPSGVESYLLYNSFSDEICFSIGTTTSDALLPYTSNIINSEKPTIQSVLEKVIEYYTDK